MVEDMSALGAGRRDVAVVLGPQAASEMDLEKGCIWIFGGEGRGQHIWRQECSVKTPHSSEESVSGALVHCEDCWVVLWPDLKVGGQTLL